MNLVLSVLKKPPFKNIWEIPLLTLSQKVAFLVAVASARRVSELVALSCHMLYLVVHKDKLVLGPYEKRGRGAPEKQNPPKKNSSTRNCYEFTLISKPQ